MQQMKKKNIRRFWIGALILSILGCIFAVYTRHSFYGQALDKELVVTVTESTTYAELEASIRPVLHSSAHRKAFDYYAKRLNLRTKFREGDYTFSKEESVVSIVRKLVSGNRRSVKLVIGEARTLPQLAGKLSKQIKADSTTLLLAMRNEQIRKELGYVKDSTIAMFIPNTYEVYNNISAEDLLRRISRENSRFWSEERTAKLERCKLSKYEVMTLASIVYEETKRPDEMRMIAGVYINRLRAGWTLGACPTVKYAIGDFSLKRVLAKHTKYDSPFNTYKYAGLPPAPICIPSIDAIDAVLNYEEHKYFYFCASPDLDGSNVFARTLKEHNINAKKYQRALDRLGIK